MPDFSKSNKSEVIQKYTDAHSKYLPDVIKYLLICESPPPSGKSYFYFPKKMNPERDISSYSSLPATIFYHYCKIIPSTNEDYENLLNKLKLKGIFLMDICDEPLRIRDRNCPGWINRENLEILISHIPKLMNKIKKRIGGIKEEKIIFLLPRNHYKRLLKEYFPKAQYYSWKEFRMEGG